MVRFIVRLLGLSALWVLGLYTPVWARTFGDEEKPKKLKVGDDAPDFTVPGTLGRAVTLSDFKGKQAVLPAFYPADQTPGCTRRMRTLKERHAEFEKLAVTQHPSGARNAPLRRPSSCSAPQRGLLTPGGMNRTRTDGAQP